MSEANSRSKKSTARARGDLAPRKPNDSLGSAGASAPGAEREVNDDALEGFRNYLLRVADRALTPELKTKEGASDVVQDTLVEAHRVFHRFEGRTDAELRAWLGKLLMNQVAHAARRYRGTDKRRLGREVSLDFAVGGQDLDEALVADHTSPGGQAVRNEEELALTAALERLPERMRQAVLWRHHESCGFDEMGRRLGCSNVAARKLWLRALEQLQGELTDPTGRATTPG
jgi:RNA polymerase sigma-70 factor (ECF subfamily)